MLTEPTTINYSDNPEKAEKLIRDECIFIASSYNNITPNQIYEELLYAFSKWPPWTREFTIGYLTVKNIR